jgi:hypothetical protein
MAAIIGENRIRNATAIRTFAANFTFKLLPDGMMCKRATPLKRHKVQPPGT